jgi:CDP-diacylglycerol---serine O-phosphatidyltransferase
MSREEFQGPKIFLLPNLMTAGNLLCGFAAVLRILEGALLQSSNSDAAAELFRTAIWFILAAFIFDTLDGRVARLAGQESPFGREFDSLADLVSFGVAPAMMVYRIVLQDFPSRAGWMVACLYLVCGALRLARFNCISACKTPGSSTDFKGFPIPAAAGLIASLTLFMLWMAEGEHYLGRWKLVLPPLMIFLSFMMFSGFKYPSFKAVDWRTKKSVPKFIAIIILMGVTVMNYEWMPAILFLAYLLYGVLRPWLSRRWREELEEQPDPQAPK